MFKPIPIPGRTTSLVDIPTVRIRTGNGMAKVTIRYVVRKDWVGEEEPGIRTLGEINFKDVMEYRWMLDHYATIDFRQDYDDSSENHFGLNEVLGSAYKENMLSKSVYGFMGKGRRLGDETEEGELKHYTIHFFDYGRFDILAFDVTVREIQKEIKPGTR